jgi:hypothetical protein
MNRMAPARSTWRRILLGVGGIIVAAYVAGLVMGMLRHRTPGAVWPADGLRGLIDGCKRTGQADVACVCYGSELTQKLPWSDFVAATEAQAAQKPVAPPTLQLIKASAERCFKAK